jgi:signal transduction histidine kinase
MWVDHSQLLSTDERLDIVVVVVIIIIIVSCYAVLVRTLAGAHRRFRNLIKTLVRTPQYN